MAEMVEKATSAIAGFKPFDQNVGKGALYVAGLGMIDALSGLLEKLRIPRMATGPAISLAVTKIKPVSDFLGPTLTDVFNTCGYAAPIDEYLRLRERVAKLVGKPIGALSPGSSSSSGSSSGELESLRRQLESVQRQLSERASGETRGTSRTGSRSFTIK